MASPPPLTAMAAYIVMPAALGITLFGPAMWRISNALAGLDGVTTTNLLRCGVFLLF